MPILLKLLSQKSAMHFGSSSQSMMLKMATLREAKKVTRNWASFMVTPGLWNNLPTKIYLAPSLFIIQEIDENRILQSCPQQLILQDAINFNVDSIF